MQILANMTQAFGGYGGISQYNRDMLGAMSGFESARRVDVVLRRRGVA